MMAAIAGLAVLGLQAPADGLRWQAGPGCPDAAAVTATIERRLGRALRVGEASVDATVVRVGREFRLSLRLAVAGRGEAREVVDESCAALAEVVALRRASEALHPEGTQWRLDGCTLVVTLEPCPLCAGAVWAAQVGRVVYGAADLKAGAMGSLYNVAVDQRLNHTTEVVSGLRATEAADLLTSFFAARR